MRLHFAIIGNKSTFVYWSYWCGNKGWCFISCNRFELLFHHHHNLWLVRLLLAGSPAHPKPWANVKYHPMHMYKLFTECYSCYSTILFLNNSKGEEVYAKDDAWSIDEGIHVEETFLGRILEGQWQTTLLKTQSGQTWWTRLLTFCLIETRNNLFYPICDILSIVLL